MGTNKSATFAKRARERERQEKRKEKAAQRAKRRAEKAEKAERADVPEGVDPDIAGIVPGPQPRQEGDEI